MEKKNFEKFRNVQEYKRPQSIVVSIKNKCMHKTLNPTTV